MNAKVLALLVAIVGLAALLGCSGNPQARGEESAEGEASGDALALEIGGSPETEFSGTCAVGDAEPEEIGGRTPQSFTYDLADRPLECEIASEGRMEVTLVHGNNRSVQRISGGTLDLVYENGSVSTSTSSSSASSQYSSRVSDAETRGTAGRSADVASETRDVSGFDEVELRWVGDLSIRQTGRESLTIEAEEGVLPRIETEVADDRLIIGPEPNTNIQTTRPISYELSVDDLRVLEVSGSGDVDAEEITTDELAVTMTGSGSVVISGRADSQTVDVSGSGKYRAMELKSKEVQIDVEGAGSAIVNASESLDAKVGGAGSVEYVGDPRVKENVSGAGRISEY